MPAVLSEGQQEKAATGIAPAAAFICARRAVSFRGDTRRSTFAPKGSAKGGPSATRTTVETLGAAPPASRPRFARRAGGVLSGDDYL